MITAQIWVDMARSCHQQGRMMQELGFPTRALVEFAHRDRYMQYARQTKAVER